MKRMPVLVTASVAALLIAAFVLNRAAALMPASPGGDPVIVAAGDIACPDAPCRGQKTTASLIGQLDPAAVLPLGDTQYPSGGVTDYRGSYDPTWGLYLGKTYPVPGNHEYFTKNAKGYFTYFAARTFGSSGWYSYNLGAWHMVALNSMSGGAPSDAQLSWLRSDLAHDTHRCQLAYWHHPRFSSGVEHGSDARMGAFWNLLQPDGVDVVLNGHEHNYERFRPMLPSGASSSVGIREFVVGTGGIGSTYGFRDTPLPNSQVRLNAIGVLDMTLHADGYDWRFVKGGGSVADQGTGSCHGP